MRSTKNYPRLLRAKTALVSIALLMTLTSCNSTKLYLIDKEDIKVVHEGEVVTAPRDGVFLSETYLKKVLDAKVKKA